MKIAILTQYYKPEMGAPQNRLYEMAVGLKKFGADITVITAMQKKQKKRSIPGFTKRF